VRARDVPSEAVADHDGILRCEVERRERRFEDARIGLSDADLGRDDHGLERRREDCVRKFFSLDVGRAVSHERKAVVAGQVSHDRVGIGIDQLGRTARGAEGVCGRVHEVVVDDPTGGQREAPHSAAEVGNELPKCLQAGGLALELAPQRFTPPDAHRVRIGELG